MNAIGSKSAKKPMPKGTNKVASKAAPKTAIPDAELHGAARLKSSAGKLIHSLVHAIAPGHSGKQPAVATATQNSKAAATARAAGKTQTAGKALPKPASATAAAAARKSGNGTNAVTAGAATGKSRAESGKIAAAGNTDSSQENASQASTQSPQPATRLRNHKTAAGTMDKTEQIVVLKASEVATKTPKSTSTAAAGSILTEAQVLEMDEKDYMNAAQRAFFKARLQQLERDLLKNADETTEHLRETVLVPDPADRATIEEEHALELRTRDRERKLLKKIQQSIASIDSGDYGWCEETGEPIGVARLLARPTATLSLEAQQRRELKQKLYGD